MKNVTFTTWLLVFSWIALNHQSIFAQSTIVLQPGPELGKDALLRENDPNGNHGMSSEFISYDWTFSGIESRGFSVIQFDLSSLPANAAIIEAKLSLYHNSKSGSAGQAGNNACYLKKLTSKWDENLVTWNTMPTSTTNDQVFLMNSTTSNQDYPDIDITSFVKEWYSNPLSNNGMILELIEQSLYNSMKFCSSDCPDSALRPKLEIIYTINNSISKITRNTIEFTIFPNPTSDFINLDFGYSSEKRISFDIINSIGQYFVSKSKITNKTRIDVSDLPKGVYIIKVYSDNIIATRKFIRS